MVIGVVHDMPKIPAFYDDSTNMLSAKRQSHIRPGFALLTSSVFTPMELGNKFAIYLCKHARDIHSSSGPRNLY